MYEFMEKNHWNKNTFMRIYRHLSGVELDQYRKNILILYKHKYHEEKLQLLDGGNKKIQKVQGKPCLASVYEASCVRISERYFKLWRV